MFHMLRNSINRFIEIFYRIFYHFIQVDENTVLFLSFHGRNCADNPKAIYECMRNNNQFKNYKFVWALRHQQNTLDSDIEKKTKVIKYLSLSFFYYLAKSKYWVFNCKTYPFMRKKENQIYLQTWHGTPLKRLGHDINVSSNTKFYRSGLSVEEMKSTYDDDVSKYTYMISPNSFCTEVFQSAFRINKERLIETGYPRNDILTNATGVMKQKIRDKYQILDGKKIILYAPTWRDNSFTAAGYTFELKADFCKWKEVLGEEYVVLFKPHYLIINQYENSKELKGFLFNIDPKDEISDLYLISDILITDYSSVFFDYAILKRPIYFYMYDIDSYREELRGFYIDIYKDLPGKIYEQEDTMLTDIAAGVYDYGKLESFNAYFNEHEDGKASERVIDIVFKE